MPIYEYGYIKQMEVDEKERLFLRTYFERNLIILVLQKI